MLDPISLHGVQDQCMEKWNGVNVASLSHQVMAIPTQEKKKKIHNLRKQSLSLDGQVLSPK